MCVWQRERWGNVWCWLWLQLKDKPRKQSAYEMQRNRPLCNTSLWLYPVFKQTGNAFHGGAQTHSRSVRSSHSDEGACGGSRLGGYLYDRLGQSDLVLLDLQRLHPSLLLVVQDLTQLCGHFSLRREEPGNKSLTKHWHHATFLEVCTKQRSLSAWLYGPLLVR